MTMTKTPVLAGVRFTPFASFIGAPRVAFEAEGVGSGQNDDATAAEAAAAATLEAEAAAAELAAAEEAAAAEEDASKDVKTLAGEKAKLLREVMDKKTKLKDAEKKAADANAALAAYEGVDPARVKELVKRELEAERAAAEAKGDFDRVKAMMVEEHGKETKTLKEKIAELEVARQADRATIDGLTVGVDFGTSVYIKDALTLTPSKARVLYGAHFEVQEGRTVAFDKPAGKSDRTMLVNASGEPLPFDEAFKRIVEADPDKDTILKAKVAPGSGSTSTAQPTKTKQQDTVGFGIGRIRAGIEELA